MVMSRPSTPPYMLYSDADLANVAGMSMPTAFRATESKMASTYPAMMLTRKMLDRFTA
jgi:hypothetical protein